MQTTGDLERTSSPNEAEPPGVGVAGQRRRHDWPWWTASLAAVLLVALAGFWWFDSQVVMNVSAATGIPDCKGTTTQPFEMHPGSGFRQPAILMNKGFVCTITVEVWNHSEFAVTLGEATLPGGNPGRSSGVGYEVTTIGGQDVSPSRTSTDAMVDLNEPIGPGGAQYIEYRVVYRTANCDSAGVTQGFTPTIMVNRQLASHKLSITDFPFFRATHTSFCP